MRVIGIIMEIIIIIIISSRIMMKINNHGYHMRVIGIIMDIIMIISRIMMKINMQGYQMSAYGDFALPTCDGRMLPSFCSGLAIVSKCDTLSRDIL